jgi:HAMP domain-containing protein
MSSLVTRLSILLFLVVLATCVGTGVAIQQLLESVQESMQTAERTQRTQWRREQASREALILARSFETLLEARLAELSERTAIIAQDPRVLEAIQTGGERGGERGTERAGERGAEREAAGTESLSSMLEVTGVDLAFHWVVTTSGRFVASWPAPPETIDSVLSSEEGDDTNQRPIQQAVQRAVAGESVGWMLVIQSETLAFYNARTSRREGKLRLVLLASHPVTGIDGQVQGVLVGAIDVLEDATLLSRLQLQLEHSDAELGVHFTSGYIGLSEQPIRVEGEYEALGARLAGEQSITFTQGEREVAVLALRDAGDELIGALLVSLHLPEPPPGLESGFEVAVERRLWRNAMNLAGMVALLVIMLGTLILHRQLAPLETLGQRAREVSLGHSRASFRDLMTRDELGSLAASLERLRFSVFRLLDRHLPPEPESPPDDPPTSSRGGA